MAPSVGQYGARFSNPHHTSTNHTMSESIDLEVVPESTTVESTSRIDIRVATARAFPRNIGQVKEDLKAMALSDDESAAGCFYTLPRGGKSITGPSIRLAEMAANAWGNLVVATRIKAVDSHSAEPHVVIEGVVSDLQKNVHVSVEKRRRIVTKKDFNTGGRKPVDEDDINLAVNSCSAIAYRDAVFKAVPRVIINPVFDAARRVAVGDLKSIGERRNKVIDRLKQMGAGEKAIFAAIGVSSIEEVTAEKVEELIGLGTSLKDGAVTLEEAFPEPSKAPEVKVAPPTPPGPAKRARKAPEPRNEAPSNPTPEPPDDVPMDDTPAKEPEPPSQAEPEAPDQAPATSKSPQAELETLLVNAGHTFEDFAIIIAGNYAQWFPDNARWKGFADVSDKDCARILKAPTGLLNAIAKAKAQATA